MMWTPRDGMIQVLSLKIAWHQEAMDETILDSIRYVNYQSEAQMPDIMQLIQKDLSEPYSVYTYRYFINNWSKLCFLVSDTTTEYSSESNLIPLNWYSNQYLDSSISYQFSARHITRTNASVPSFANWMHETNLNKPTDTHLRITMNPTTSNLKFLLSLTKVILPC